MSNTPIAATAGAARQRLASSLAAMQQDPTVPAAVLKIVEGLARAMGPLFQVERGSGEPTLIFQARTVLQETLGAMQSVDQSYPGVGDATAAIAQSLGMLFAAIKEHSLVDPATLKTVEAPAVQQAPVVQQPAAQPVPLTTPAAQPMPLTTPAAQAVPLVQHGQVKPPQRKAEPKPRPATVFPQTAATVPIGPRGVPHVEAEIEAFSQTNFFTNFVGDIRDHGGLFVATYAVLAINTDCEVSLKFPGDLLAEFQGVVKWRRQATQQSNVDDGSEPGMGIEITNASTEAWALINRFIQKREPMIHDV